MRNLSCYLCGSTNNIIRQGSVRDSTEIKPLDCGLVFLSSLGHIAEEHYAESGMHGGEFDDERRFNQLKESLVNKRVLDFGCGAADRFVYMLTASVELAGLRQLVEAVK